MEWFNNFASERSVSRDVRRHVKYGGMVALHLVVGRVRFVFRSRAIKHVQKLEDGDDGRSACHLHHKLVPFFQRIPHDFIVVRTVQRIHPFKSKYKRSCSADIFRLVKTGLFQLVGFASTIHILQKAVQTRPSPPHIALSSKNL